MPRGRMLRIPFADGWAITQEPGLPVADEEEDNVLFEEPPASPDPSSPATSCYEITASGVVSESSSIPTSGLPTPPPTVTPPIPIAALIRAAAQRLQEAVPDAAPVAAQDAAQAAPDAAQATWDAAPDAAREPPRPRRSQRIEERNQRVASAAASIDARARLRRTPQRVAKMLTGGVRKH